MSMNTELLQFMDGTLAPEQEAELLHRLSVSPERREILRSFFNMKVLLERDRNSIAVPYAAEQKLWARLGGLMPPAMQNAAVPAVIETAATSVSRTGIFSTAFSVAAVAVICLLVGLGSGFFVGKNTTAPNVIAESSPAGQTLSPSLVMSETPDVGKIRPMGRMADPISTLKHTHSRGESQNTFAPNPGAPLDIGAGANASPANANADPANADREISKAKTESLNTYADISSVTPKQMPETSFNSPNVRDPNHYWEHSPFSMEEQGPQKTFLQKWEFYVNFPSIGKQFPNNTATNVSMPIVTNQSIGASYQPWDNSRSIFRNVWFGLTLGTANVTQRKYSILQKDPSDPKQGYEMAADLVHVQTSYIGGLLQYRIPIGAKWAGTITGMGAPSSAGTLWSAELGAHYEATSNFGIVAGVRGTYLSYNLDLQQQQVIAQGVSAFGIPAPVASQTKQQSYNLEISSGIYFHF